MPKVNRLFFDVMAMALACDVTRVISMMWGGGESAEPVDFIGMKDWHGISHGDPNGLPGQQITRMQAYLAGEVTYLVEKLRSMSADGRRHRGRHAAGQHGRRVRHAERQHQPGQLRQGRPPALERPDGPRRPRRRRADPGRAARLPRAPTTTTSTWRSPGRSAAAAKTVGDPAWCKGPLPGLLA